MYPVGISGQLGPGPTGKGWNTLFRLYGPLQPWFNTLKLLTSTAPTLRPTWWVYRVLRYLPADW
jgi:hypothetical protein